MYSVHERYDHHRVPWRCSMNIIRMEVSDIVFDGSWLPTSIKGTGECDCVAMNGAGKWCATDYDRWDVGNMVRGWTKVNERDSHMFDWKAGSENEFVRSVTLYMPSRWQLAARWDARMRSTGRRPVPEVCGKELDYLLISDQREGHAGCVVAS